MNFIRDLGFGICDLPVLARVRYRQPLASATLQLTDLKTYKLKFDEPQKYVAIGQSAVFYSDDGPAFAKASAGKEMLGGGVIADVK